MTSEWTDPGVGVVRVEDWPPSGFMFGPMMMTAQRGKIACRGGPTIDYRNAVIEIAVDGGHTTSWEHTGSMIGFDYTPHAGGGPA